MVRSSRPPPAAQDREFSEKFVEAVARDQQVCKIEIAPGRLLRGVLRLLSPGGFMAAMSKMGGQLFPRKRYTGGTTTRTYTPTDRTRVTRLFGQGFRVHLHCRVYDRSGSGAPVAAVSFLHGCFGEEYPAEALALWPYEVEIK